MDFGGPIGYRLMLGISRSRHRRCGPEYAGIRRANPGWPALGDRAERTGRTGRRRIGMAAVRSKLTPDAVRNQYVAGTREPSLIDPDNWTIDSALLARPGVDEIMLDLLYDIRNNRQTVADARQFSKAHQHQVMNATGVNDPLFPGASMKLPADMPEIEFHPIDSGHFALEDHCAEIGRLTRSFLTRVMPA